MSEPRRPSFLLANFPIAEAHELAHLAEAGGTRRVWLAETFGPDFSVVAGVLAATTDLELGCAIIPVFTRTPTTVGLLASSIVEVSGRPFHLGLGTGGQATIERWHGMPYRRTVERTRDFVAIVRQVLSGERTAYRGEVLTGEGYRLPWPPRADVLVYLGAMGDRMTALAAEVADGIIVSWGWPGMLEGYVRGLRDLVARAGRDPSSFRVVVRLYTSVTDDLAAVRDAVRDELVGYLASPAQAAFFARFGFEDEIVAFREAFSRGDRPGTKAAISDRMLDTLIPVGTAEALRRAADERWACGIDDLMVQPVPRALGGNPARTIECLSGR